MGDPPVFCRFFFLLGKMEQDIEPAEVRILRNNGLRLLILERIQFMNRIDEPV